MDLNPLILISASTSLDPEEKKSYYVLKYLKKVKINLTRFLKAENLQGSLKECNQTDLFLVYPIIVRKNFRFYSCDEYCGWAYLPANLRGTRTNQCQRNATIRHLDINYLQICSQCIQ